MPQSSPVALAHVCALGLGHLKVFFSQHGTRGVARVYVDHEGTAFVGIRPGLSLVLVAKPSAVIARLLLGIAVEIG
jgi:hypothetical protein